VISELQPGEFECLQLTRAFMPTELCCPDTGAPTGTLLTDYLPDGSIQVTFIQPTNITDNTMAPTRSGGPSPTPSTTLATTTTSPGIPQRPGPSCPGVQTGLHQRGSDRGASVGWGTLGFGGDGALLFGNAGDVVGFGTSLTDTSTSRRS